MDDSNSYDSFITLQLNDATTKITRPVVLIDGQDARKLMSIVNK